jgi:HK97 family phage portal protein
MWNPFRKQIEKKSTTTRSIILDDLTSDFLSSCLLEEIITPQKAFDFYRKNSSVATAVDMIADSFEQIEPIIKLSDGSTIEKHPVLDLLKNPNSFMTWSDFAARISRNYLLTNQTHFYALGGVTVSPSEIYPIKPTNVSISTSENEYVEVFYVGQGVGVGSYVRELAKQRISRYYDGPLKELYRISGFSSMSTDGTADSPLQAAALETNQQIKGRVHNVKMLDNGGRLSLMVIFKEEQLSDDEHKERTQRINESWAGPENAGKIGVMSGGDIQSVTEMGVNQKDMDYAELDKIAAQAIYFRYKIPLPLITVSASTFNNMQTAIEMLYDFAVLPLADKLFTGMSRFILPRFGMDLNSARITFSPDSLQALKARRLNELKLRKEIGIETTNELREKMSNRLPIDGGDTLYQPATLVPIGMDINDNGMMNNGPE